MPTDSMSANQKYEVSRTSCSCENLSIKFTANSKNARQLSRSNEETRVDKTAEKTVNRIFLESIDFKLIQN